MKDVRISKRKERKGEGEVSRGKGGGRRRKEKQEDEKKRREARRFGQMTHEKDF